MSLITPQLMTAEDLWQLPDNGMRRALIDGALHETMSPEGVHGAIAAVLATLLRLWVEQHGSGYVGVDAGYVLHRVPDRVRGPREQEQNIPAPIMAEFTKVLA